MKREAILSKWKLLCAMAISSILPGAMPGQSFDQNHSDCGGMIVQGGNQQKALASTCTNASTAYTTKYSHQSTYVPTTNDPVITVKVTFHIFNKADGSGSFPNSTTGVQQLQQVAAWIHNGYDRYSNPRSANYTTTGFVAGYNQDSRVNYEVTNIYFYNDDILNGTAPNDAPLFNAINAADPNRLNEGLPIIFNNGSYLSAAGYASVYNGRPYVHTFVVSPPMGLWWVATSHLLHEIGHCMGWYHTYQGGGDEAANGFACPAVNFLSDVFPQNNSCTNQLGCGACFEVAPTYTSNNVMSGNADNSWMSPLQQGRRIMNLHLQPVRYFVKEMTSGTLNPWLITSNETWDFDIQMYKDIIVKSGSTLTVKCNLAMANNGRIIVERGAKLVIDGGTIKAWGSSWAGIQVWGTSTKNQVITSGLSVDQGIVQIVNQGTLQDAVNAITTIKYDENGNIDWGGYTGGIIQCDGARFINNWRAIQYMSYHNYNAANSSIVIDDIGYVKNSLFETNAILKDANLLYPQVFVSMWDVRGVKYLGNTYQNTVSPAPSIDHLGSGFTSNDANYTIDRYQVCSVINSITGQCAQYSANTPSTFTNLQYGVQNQNIASPVSNITINNNDFVGCNRAVYISGTYNTRVTNNRINVGNGQNTTQLLPYGIYFENSSGYTVSNNSIYSTQWTDYNFSIGTGICINGSNGLNNSIYRNNVNMMGAGATVYGDNQGTNPGDGLKFTCNSFGQGTSGKNYIDLNMGFSTNPTWHNGMIDKYQGSSTAGANNYFSHAGNVSPYTKTDYSDNAYTGVPSANNTVHYYYNSGNTNLQPYYYDPSMTIQSVAAAFNANSMCPQTPGGGGGGSGGSGMTAAGPGKSMSIAELKVFATETGASAEALKSKMLNSRLSKEDVQKLNSEIAALNHQKGMAFDEAFGRLVSDPEGMNGDALAELLKADDRSNADVKLLAVYMSLHKLNEASAQLEVIRNNRGKSYSTFCDQQQALIDLLRQPAGIYSIKSNGAAQSLMRRIGSNEQEPGYVYARAILKAVYNEPSFEYITLPGTESFANAGYRQNEETDMLEAIDDSFSIYPNPSKDDVHAVFVTHQKYSTAEIIVYDNTGKTVLKQQVPAGSNKATVSVADFKPGLYLVTITLDGIVKDKRKLVKN